ncbi:MAG: nitronate monooxygenase [Microthrixaceae bacterium]|nr:nitronate monooxygenase [Microthrixaceae bacterium]
MNPRIPLLIQGGMGVGISGWRLANAVSGAGGLGVVAGTALEITHARQLSDGDQGGHLRRAYAAFPDQEVVERVLGRWYIPGGKAPEDKYRNVPLGRLDSAPALRELIVLANFAEVWLAREGHEGQVGINFLEKLQVPTPEGIYGAMLAGVNAVLMGAGIPAGIPRLLDDLAVGRAVEYTIDVAGATRPHAVHFDPRSVVRASTPEGLAPPLLRPGFLAIISSNTLANFLLKDPETSPDGFVVEGSGAGGHNAPPRGKLVLDERGEPVYGPRDRVDLAKLASTGVPFWLAGGIDTPAKVVEALAAGAEGVQVGTPFALSVDSGMSPAIRRDLIAAASRGELVVRTDPRASPSGYPFKVAQLKGTVAEPDIYRARQRVCDIGLLRTAYEREDGSVGWRCPAEPVDAFVSKGGTVEETEGRACLCNGLVATVELGQRRTGGLEPPIVTIGDDIGQIVATLGDADGMWSALDVIRWLTSELSGSDLAAESPQGT